MKVTVMGGGSSYTPELINGFLERRDTFPLTELWLADILPERLEIVGKFAQRMVAANGSPFQIKLTTNQQQAIAGAQYVTTQLRVGWMQARKEDEYLGKRHGLIGQETTGVGGMAKALRTIPVILSIADDVKKHAAPGALLVNFTNPAGLVTEALSRYAPDVNSVGVCNAPITTQINILKTINEKQNSNISLDRTRLNTLGLNHLTWHRGFTIDGEEVWPRVMESLIQMMREEETPYWTPSLLENLQMLPNYYLQYFYYTNKKLAEQGNWPPSRAEQVMKIEEELFAQYAEPDRKEPPAGLMQRGGAYYSTVATQLLNAHYNDLQETHVVNVPHRGAVPGWPEDWVLEMPCVVGKDGIKPIAAEPLPTASFALLNTIKQYELLTVEAAVHGRKEDAYQALLVHPLGPSADEVETVLEDMLTINKPYLPQFA